MERPRSLVTLPSVEHRWAQGPLWRDLDERALTAIANHLVPRSFAAGDILIRQGVWAGELFIIRRGIVQIALEAGPAGEHLADRPAMPLRRLVAGDPFGEMSLITGMLPSATAQALTDGAAWVLSQRDFLRLVLAHPVLSHNVNAILSERLAYTSQQRMTKALPQVSVIVDSALAPWLVLAREVARLSRQRVLLIDCTNRAGAGMPARTLADLLDGHLQPGARTAQACDGEDMLTIIRHYAADSAPDSPLDLVAALGHLGVAYQHTLVVSAPGQRALRSDLLVYATRVLVAGEADRLPALRMTLADLPRPPRHEAQPHLHAVVTHAPAGLARTTATRELLARELGLPIPAILPAAPSQFPCAMRALARWVTGQRIGLAFGAGGAKGFAHLGVIRALRRLGLPVDCVAGTSIGAIVGAGVAMELSTEALVERLRTGSECLFHPTVPRFSLLSTRSIARWMQQEQMYGQRLIEQLPLPFAVSAADLVEGCEHVVRRGLLWRAVLASTAIPGLFPPVKIGEHWLVDGAVVNPVPVSTALLLDADLVIAVDLAASPDPAQEVMAHGDRPSPRMALPDIIVRSRDIMLATIHTHTAGHPALVIRPQVTGIALLDFAGGQHLMEAGEVATDRALPHLRTLLPWLDDA